MNKILFSLVLMTSSLAMANSDDPVPGNKLSYPNIRLSRQSPPEETEALAGVPEICAEKGICPDPFYGEPIKKRNTYFKKMVEEGVKGQSGTDGT